MSLFQRVKDNFSHNWPAVSQALKRFFIVLSIVVAFLAIYFFNRIFISVDSGSSGVLWKRFFGGTDLENRYDEGFHIIFPWDRMTIYNMRIQQVPHEFVALSKDGLPINVEVSIRYRPQAAKLPQLHQDVGPDYVEKIVKPEVQAMIRFVLAQYSPEEIYTSEGFLLNIIKQGALGQILERHILVDDLLIKRLSLPDKVRDAIESKLVQQQIVQEYKYRLERESQEAERKRTEAAGIRDFQLEAMKGGAFDKYLRYQGIEATVELAKSPNAKMVVIGGGSDGLPLILNMPDGATNTATLSTPPQTEAPLLEAAPSKDAAGQPEKSRPQALPLPPNKPTGAAAKAPKNAAPSTK